MERSSSSSTSSLSSSPWSSFKLLSRISHLRAKRLTHYKGQGSRRQAQLRRAFGQRSAAKRCEKRRIGGRKEYHTTSKSFASLSHSFPGGRAQISSGRAPENILVIHVDRFWGIGFFFVISVEFSNLEQ